MRVMVFVKGDAGSEAAAVPSAEAMAEMDRFTEQLVEAKVLVAGAGLKAGADAKRIGHDGTSRIVMDGPFTEARELVAGFWIWEVKDMAEAIYWASLQPGQNELEIRPFMEFEDLAGALPEGTTPHGGERGRLGVA